MAKHFGISLFLFAYTVGIAFAVIFISAALIPSAVPTAVGTAPAGMPLDAFGINATILPETSLWVLVLAAGAGGAIVHSLGSLAAHIGRQTFSPEWTLWHIVHPLRGAMLASVVYGLLRGGQFVLGGDGLPSNPFLILAACGVAGLSTEHTTEMLKKWFSERFAPSRGVQEQNAGATATQAADAASGIATHATTVGVKAADAPTADIVAATGLREK